jgi:mediator of RNA polymerase II transcription subunit 31
MYLTELHAQEYLDKEEFLNYLTYLEYWRKPEYVQFIV